MQAVAKGGYGSTKVLLLCGILTGPLFLVVAIIQAITRSGYNVRLNAVSQLSLGDRGWIQITSFLLAGLLGVRCATGVRRTCASTDEKDCLTDALHRSVCPVFRRVPARDHAD